MSKINNKSTKAEMEAYIKELEAQLKEKQEMDAQAARIAELEAQLASSTNTTETVSQTVTPQITVVAPTNEVTLVYMSDSIGYAKVNSTELHFNRFGEKFVLSRSQFDELVGKYRSWFDRGVLAVDSSNVDVAAAKGLPTDKEYYLTANILNSIGRMSSSELENLWAKCETKSHKESIVLFVKRKFIEGDEAYRNREKIDLLNRLTNGGFEREQDELSGRLKISQTDM